jgi:hypothetical protein
MRAVNPPEFFRPVRVDDLPPGGRSFESTASASERDALARRFSLAGRARLEVAGEVVAIRGGTVVRLVAKLCADVTQTCVVTLAPLERRIEAEFVRLYSAQAAAAAADGEEIFYDEEAEEIEPLTGNRIDAGEAAAEQLALELDPFPRAPGAAAEAGEGAAFAAGAAGAQGARGTEGEGEPAGPFAALSALAGRAPQKQRK